MYVNMTVDVSIEEMVTAGGAVTVADRLMLPFRASIRTSSPGAKVSRETSRKPSPAGISTSREDSPSKALRRAPSGARSVTVTGQETGDVIQRAQLGVHHAGRLVFSDGDDHFHMAGDGQESHRKKV